MQQLENCENKTELLAQHSVLQGEVVRLAEQVTKIRGEPLTTIPKEEDTTNLVPSSVQDTSPSGSESDTLSDGSEQSKLPLQRKTKTLEPHPPGFKVLISRVISLVVIRELMTSTSG